MSDSYSDCHSVNWSSGGIEATIPRYVPPFSMVAMSISMCRRVRYAMTAWQASCTATAWRSRSMYSTSSGGPSSLSCLALMTSFHVMTSRPSRMAMISDSLTRSLIVAPVAYGVIVASLSISSAVSSCRTLAR